ncbi:MAG: hypothetical protein KDC94_09715 [Aequorivita sp.]|nr:hypothetical protein [Aequorivita sp.]MCB0456048.1 hypothetical protein [Aequorivita sp.]MCB0468630.1 hypothetical protein [Aequorivita sp.]HPE82774.1 hypothetical protein [Aequorivita sp.]
MKKLAPILAALCLIASIVMYMVGKNSSHLSELKDFFWVPLPLAVICLLIAFSKKK